MTKQKPIPELKGKDANRLHDVMMYEEGMMEGRLKREAEILKMIDENIKLINSLKGNRIDLRAGELTELRTRDFEYLKKQIQGDEQ